LLADVAVVVVADVEVAVADSREEAGALLVAEAIFREEVAISPEVREVFPEVVGVSLVVAVSLGAAVFLEAAAAVSPEAETVLPAVVAAGFPGAAIVSPARAVAVPLDISEFRMILRCSPILGDRAPVVVECHRMQTEVNPATLVHRWAEARHSCRPAIGRVVTSQIGPRNFPLVMKAVREHVEAIFNLSVRAVPAIFSAWPAALELVLRLAKRPQIGLTNFQRIVLLEVNRPLLPSNAQIGTLAR